MLAGLGAARAPEGQRQAKSNGCRWCDDSNATAHLGPDGAARDRSRAPEGGAGLVTGPVPGARVPWSRPASCRTTKTLYNRHFACATVMLRVSEQL